MKKAYIILASVATFVVANAQAYVAGWDFQSTTTADNPSSYFTSDRNQGASASLISSDFTFTTGLGLGSSAQSSLGQGTFFDNNGFQNGNTGNNLAGTKSLRYNGSSSSATFRIEFDGTSSTNTALYFTYAAQDFEQFGSYDSDEEWSTDIFSVEMFNGTTSLGNVSLAGSEKRLSSNNSYNDKIDAEDISVLDGVSAASLVFTVNAAANTSSANIIFDNIAIGGTGTISAVPEPSTYAAIAGALALAFAAYRRRK